MPDRKASNEDEHAKILATAQTYLQVPFHQFLQPKLLSVDPSSGSRISFLTAPNLLIPGKTLHAGAVYIGTELSNVLASLCHVQPGETMASVNHAVTLLATTVGEGKEVHVTSRMLKRGKTLAFFESEAVEVATGTVLAKAKTVKTVVVDKKRQTSEANKSKSKSKL